MDLRLQTECKANILRYLENVKRPAELTELVSVYHITYKRNPHVVPVERLSSLLAKMEREGLIICAYTTNGLVETARRKET